MSSTADPNPLRYADLFADPAANPFGADTSRRHSAYAGIYRRFASHPTPLSVNKVLGEVLNLFKESSVPRLRVIHGIRKYPGNLLTPSRNANKLFGYLNDVVSGRGELVQVTTSMFTLIPNRRRVYTPLHHRLFLEAHPELSFVSPVPEGGGHSNTKELQCRHTFFIPFELMPLLNKRLSPREAFTIIQPWLEHEGLETIAGPLLDSLRVAGTNASTEDNQTICKIAANEPGPLF